MTTSRIRHHTLARLSAVWLTVLIVLPFTAPFATYDLSHGQHEVLCKDKTDTDTAILQAPLLSISFLAPFRFAVALFHPLAVVPSTATLLVLRL